MTSRRITSLFVVLAATAMLIAGCGGGDDASQASSEPASSQPASSGGASNTVTISNFKFTPATVTVTHGKAVTVTNNDSTAHTATADDGNSFDTGDVDPGASATIKVSKPGTYAYHCSIHSFMKGTLVVK
jgi:plastocyanin